MQDIWQILLLPIGWLLSSFFSWSKLLYFRAILNINKYFKVITGKQYFCAVIVFKNRIKLGWRHARRLYKCQKPLKTKNLLSQKLIKFILAHVIGICEVRYFFNAGIIIAFWFEYKSGDNVEKLITMNIFYNSLFEIW